MNRIVAAVRSALLNFTGRIRQTLQIHVSARRVGAGSDLSHNVREQMNELKSEAATNRAAADSRHVAADDMILAMGATRHTVQQLIDRFRIS